MFDAFKIGTGTVGVTAVRVRDIGEITISENSASYWIYNIMFGEGGRICKNTAEGKTLWSFLKTKTDDEISMWLKTLFIANIPTEKLLEFIKKEKQDAFNRGRACQAKKIRAALNFDQYSVDGKYDE